MKYSCFKANKSLLLLIYRDSHRSRGAIVLSAGMCSTKIRENRDNPGRIK